MLEVVELVELIVGEFIGGFGGLNGYTHRTQTPLGASHLWSNGRPEAMLSFPGACLGQLNVRQQRTLLEVLQAAGCKFTRLDVAFDDYTRCIEPGDVYQACKQGHCSGFRSFERIEAIRRSRKGTADAGASCIMGRRGKLGSGRMIVVYDKLLESGNPDLNCVRWEVRFFKEHAAVAAMIAGQDDVDDLHSFERQLRKLVGGAVRFVERINPDVAKCPDLPWWNALRVKLGEAKVRVARKVASLADSMQAIRQQFGATLAAIVEGVERSGHSFDAWIADVISGGSTKQKGRHRLAVAEFIEMMSGSPVAAAVGVGRDPWPDGRDPTP